MSRFKKKIIRKSNQQSCERTKKGGKHTTQNLHSTTIGNTVHTATTQLIVKQYGVCQQ